MRYPDTTQNISVVLSNKGVYLRCNASSLSGGDKPDHGPLDVGERVELKLSQDCVEVALVKVCGEIRFVVLA